jgi:DNA polymerase IV
MVPSPHRIILHVDMDAFFASVEQRDDPRLRNRPVIVGALPGERGVVSAASYEARVFGVRSAMPVARAYELCPGGVFVRPRMSVYSHISQSIMDILLGFSPVMEQVSIDEAYLDITGTEKLWGTAFEVAEKIRSAVRIETGCTVSIGIAPNKFLAKTASDLNKPDGVTVAPFDETGICAWLFPMPCGRLFGVGKVTEQLFFRMGIKTIGDVQALPVESLEKKFGAHGRTLYRLSRGMDSSPVTHQEGTKSISREHTFQSDTADKDRLKSTMLSLSRDVARRARREGCAGATVVLIYRGKDFTKHTKRMTLPHPTDVSRTIYETAVVLLTQAPVFGKPLRLLGVGLTGFSDASQTNLFDDAPASNALKASEKAVDVITTRFGKGAIFFGGEARSDAKTREKDKDGRALIRPDRDRPA